MVVVMHETYTSPGRLTGDHEGVLATLPDDVADLTAVGHGLMIHEFLTDAYGVSFTEADRATVHIREVPRLVARFLEVSPEPLTKPRAPELRIAANCRHFTVLLVAALRAHGVPARARCGFGAYFSPGFNEDHWVAEYWSGDRWRLVDGQLDEIQQEMFSIDFDVTDVPRDRFLVAGDAWQQWRRGEVPEDAFGLTATKESGAWWIAGNIMRDAAALMKVEVLPWDSWGVMPEPTSSLGDVDLFDRLAAATLDPELAGLAELMALPELRVPAAVRNSVLGREEAL
jgi:Transglutaminase-like superfamily